MKGSQKFKRSKLSKRVSKLMSDSKSSSSFHSSFNSSNVHRYAIRLLFEHNSFKRTLCGQRFSCFRCSSSVDALNTVSLARWHGTHETTPYGYKRLWFVTSFIRLLIDSISRAPQCQLRRTITRTLCATYAVE